MVPKLRRRPWPVEQKPAVSLQPLPGANTGSSKVCFVRGVVDYMIGVSYSIKNRTFAKNGYMMI